MSYLQGLSPEYQSIINDIVEVPDREAVAETIQELINLVEPGIPNTEWHKFNCLVGLGLKFPYFCHKLKGPEQAQVFSLVDLDLVQIEALISQMPSIRMSDGRDYIWHAMEVESSG